MQINKIFHFFSIKWNFQMAYQNTKGFCEINSTDAATDSRRFGLQFSSRSLEKARIQPPLYGLEEAYKRYHLVHPARIIHYRYLLKCEDVFQTFSELIWSSSAVYQIAVDEGVTRRRTSNWKRHERSFLICHLQMNRCPEKGKLENRMANLSSILIEYLINLRQFRISKI